MSIIRFDDGTTVKFDGIPTSADVEELAFSLGLNKPIETRQEKTRNVGVGVGQSIVGAGTGALTNLFSLGRSIQAGLDPRNTKAQLEAKAGPTSRAFISGTPENKKITQQLTPKNKYQQYGKLGGDIAQFFGSGMAGNAAGSAPIVAKLPRFAQFVMKYALPTALDTGLAYSQGKGAGMEGEDLRKFVGTTALTSGFGNALLPPGGPALSKMQLIARSGLTGYTGDVATGLAGLRGEDRTGTNALIPGIGTGTGLAIGTGIAGLQKGQELFTTRGQASRTETKRFEQLSQLERDKPKFFESIADAKKAGVEDPIGFFSQTKYLNGAVDGKGTVNTAKARQMLKTDVLDPYGKYVRQTLVKEGTAISIPDLKRSMEAAHRTSDIPGEARLQLRKALIKELEGLANQADKNGKIPLYLIHDAKTFRYDNLDYDNPTSKVISKGVARFLKLTIEKHAQSLDVRAYNEQLAGFYALDDVLRALNKSKVEGGRLGTHVSTALGAFIGGQFGSPLLAGAGAMAGKRINEGRLAGALGGNQTKGADTSKLTALQKAEYESAPLVVPRYNPKGLPEPLKVQSLKSKSPVINQKTKSTPKIAKTDIDQTIQQRDGLVKKVVRSVKESLKNPSLGLAIKNVGDDATTLNRATKYLREAKGLSANDIMKKHPDIQLKRDLTVKNIHGQTQVIPEGEVLTPYELKGNKVLLQDGKTYVVSKNQFQNVKGNALSGEAKDFAPELKGTEETVLGASKWQGDELYDNGNRLADVYEENGKWHYRSDMVEESPAFKTRKEAMENAEADALGMYSGNETKYSSRTLPGGENYKEILIKAPTKQDTKVYWDMEQYDKFPPEVTKLMDKYVDDYDGMSKALTKLGYEVDTDMSGEIIGFQKVPSKETLFKSSHWDEPNVIFHLRLNERTYKGKKVTFMEELQSDWAREARKSQEILNKERQMYERDLALLKTEKDVVNRQAKIEALEEKLADFKSDVPQTPSNPLLKNWQTLSVKRALQEAVANKSEYFAWINGEQTSARYNLATHLNSVEWKSPTKKGLYEGQQDKNVILDIAGGRGKVNLELNPQGEVIRTFGTGGENWKGKKLDEVLGKGLADSIMSKESGTLSGEGLKFGGEWANTLYDKQVGNIVKDLTGAPIEKMDMGLPIDGKKPNFSIAQDSGPLKGHFNIKATPETLKVGSEILNRETDATYIVTNILGDGKFKAVPKSAYFAEVYDPAIGIENTYKKARPDSELTQFKETFDISQKNTTQQGIRLTPEIVAKIKGESPLTKKPQQPPLEEFLAVRNRALNE